MSRKRIFNHFCRRFHPEIILKRALPVVHLPVMKLKINHIPGLVGLYGHLLTARSAIAA